MTEGEFVRFYKSISTNLERGRYTEPKKVIKFRAGKRLVEIANGDADE